MNNRDSRKKEKVEKADGGHHQKKFLENFLEFKDMSKAYQICYTRDENRPTRYALCNLKNPRTKGWFYQHLER